MAAGALLLCALSATSLLLACRSAQPAREQGSALVRRGDTAEAIAHYQRALEAHPDDLSLLTGLGEAYLYAGKRAEAEKVLLEAEARGEQRNAPLLLARLRRWQGQWEQAAEWLGPLLQRFPADAAVHLELGRLRLEAGDVSGAVEPLQAAATIDPRQVEAHVQLGIALRKLSRFADAVDALQSARLRFGGNDRARLEASLGEVHEAAGEVTAADRAYQRALNRDPYLEEAVAGRARMLRRSGDFAEAIKLLQGAVRKHPKSAALSWELAETFAAYGMPGQAFGAYEQTITLDPTWSRAYRPWLDMMATRGVSADTRFTALRKAAAHVPEDTDLQLQFLIEAHARKHYPEALKAARRILDRQPGHLDANYYLGLSQAASGQLQEASDTYEALLVLDRDKAEQVRQAVEKAQQEPPRATTSRAEDPPEKRKPAPKRRSKRRR